MAAPSPTLEPQPFLPGDESLPEVQAFDCGPEDWAQYLSYRLRSGEVSKGIASFGNEGWLFYVDDDLAGFAEIGRTERRWPNPSGPPVAWSYIPSVALATPFHSRPRGPREGRYSYQVLDFLVGRAIAHGMPGVLLNVHQLNVAARRLYDHYGFTALSVMKRGRMVPWIRNDHIVMGLLLSEPSQS